MIEIGGMTWSSLVRLPLRSEAAYGAMLATIKIAQTVWPDSLMERRLSALIDQMAPPAGSFPGIRGRVCLINTGLAAGGAERQVVNTAAGLLTAGVVESAHLVADSLDHASGKAFFAEQARRANLQIRLARPGDPTSPLSSEVRSRLEAILGRKPAARVAGYAAALMEVRPEVVHAWQDDTGVCAGIAAILIGARAVVLSTRNLAPTHFAYWRPYLRPAYRILVRHPQVRLINNSEAGAADYAHWLGIERGQIGVVRNGIEIPPRDVAIEQRANDLRRRIGVGPDTKIIVGILRFWPEKRPFLWIDTAAAVAARLPTTRFLLVGWGAMEYACRRRVTKAGLDGKVKFLPSDTPIDAILSAADVVLLTSRFEGTPNVVLEAQAAGVPVVATNAGGTAEAFLQGCTGWIAPPHCAELAAHVIAILNDPAVRAGADTEGPRFVAKRFGVSRMLAETLALYRDAGAKLVACR